MKIDATIAGMLESVAVEHCLILGVDFAGMAAPGLTLHRYRLRYTDLDGRKCHRDWHFVDGISVPGAVFVTMALFTHLGDATGHEGWLYLRQTDDGIKAFVGVARMWSGGPEWGNVDIETVEEEKAWVAAALIADDGAIVPRWKPFSERYFADSGPGVFEVPIQEVSALEVPRDSVEDL
jgi:hypothetical protein